jgi:plasmid maintenance system antidote protein VapI
MSELVLKNNITERLDNIGMSSRELSELVGLSYQKVLRVVNNGDDLRVSDAMKIAAALDSDISSIWNQVFSLKTKEVITKVNTISKI